MFEEPMERLEHACKLRDWDLDVLLSFAKVAPDIAFSARMNNKVPPAPVSRRARSYTREELNRKAKELIRELKDKKRKVVIPDEATANDAKEAAREIAQAALSKHEGNLAEVCRLACIRAETLKNMRDGTALVRFDCMLKVARVAGVNIILENINND